MKSLLARLLSAAASHELVSSNLAIGTAVTAVFASAVLGLAVDRPSQGIVRESLSLRGTLAPQDLPSGAGLTRAEAPEHTHGA